MSDNKTPKTLEELETEVVGLKIKLKRIEDFLMDMPSVEDYLGKKYSIYDADQIEDDDMVSKAIEIVNAMNGEGEDKVE